MTSKYWGEEKHPDAIYSVYLKKVRYVPPPGYDGVPRYRPIDPDRQLPPADTSLEGMTSSDHLQWESVKERHIKAGTLDKLVEALVGPDDTMDSRHFNVFFATYRAFAEPSQVLDKLLRRYESLENEVIGSTSALLIQNSIRSILVCWLDTYEEDFFDPEAEFAMLTNLSEFATRSKLRELKDKVRKLKEEFRRIVNDGGWIARLPSLERYVHYLGYDVADYSRNAKERTKMFDVGKENCVQIAEQLTYWDSILFQNLLIQQCQGCNWAKRHKLHPDKVCTVKATIDQFNAVSQRVMTSVVLPDCRPEFRAKIIAKWIDIARELRALKNFSSLKAVLSSLQSEPVHRLKSTWALVSNRSTAQFRELSTIFDMDEQGDEKNARKILEQEGTAKSSPLRRPQLVQNCRRTKSDVNLAECQGTVPYLGSFLTDLTMIDQAAQDYTSENLISFEKRRKEFDVLAKLRLFQSAARAYKIPMDRVFCAWFYFLPCLDEKECYNRSLQIEKPKDPIATPDMNGSRNMTATNSMSSIFPSALIGGSSHSTPVKNSTLSRLLANGNLAGSAPSRFGNHTHEEPNGSSSSPSTPMHSHTHSQSSSYTQNVTIDNGVLMGQCSKDLQNEDWIDGRMIGGEPGPVPLMGTLPRTSSGRLIVGNGDSLTASSTPASTISWRGGCEFSPQVVFPHRRQPSKESSSTQEIQTSLSRTSIDNQSMSQSAMSRSETPVNNGSEHNGNGNGFHCRQESLDSASKRAYGGLLHQKRPSTASTCSSGSHQNSSPAFHLARVGLDDELQKQDGGANYKVIKIENGDRMPELIARALEKHLMTHVNGDEFCLVQLLPDGGEFQLPDKCNPFYAMAPDPTSPMLNLLLRCVGLKEKSFKINH
ncbi:hypothetical protein WR25_18807 [Diploscapter pachys]|uniref:Ras-GEF domain-containing protein n=1 Tax=Diploscapter pachys TaxID=2018661 RepID=A0A2A2J8D3_9BILA|nr:hypothetical protein WR25_18807 [Diploscapter pachys]